MAIKEHVNIVLKGREAITKWRERHPNERMNLSSSNLRRAKLSYANLSHANLASANLEWADLRLCDLMETNLAGANLARADFHKADLTSSILTKANLVNTNFEDANLTQAQMDNTIFGHTRLYNTDFSNVLGLATADHKMNSEIDRETIAKVPDLPLEFLRGCGLYAAYHATVYRVVIGSPSDVAEERNLARNVVYSWNDRNSHHLNVVLLPVLWETHSVPELGDRPQAIINRELIETSQILICIFWTRIGTDTGEAESGTVEEITKFMESRKPVLVYFSNQPLPLSFDSNQWNRLQKFKKQITTKGLVDTFDSFQDLNRKLTNHLTETVHKLQHK